MKTASLAIATVLTLGLGLVAATIGTDDRSISTSCTDVLGSEVCAWVAMDGETAIELGATIPLSLVEAVPTDVEMVWPPEALTTVPLPAEAQAAFGIDHLTVNWEAHGHPPASFLTQHFDFHFYSVGEAAVGTIDCSDESKPELLPAGYALPDIEVPGMGRFVGLCVPNMGMHAMPAHEVHESDPFDASMMVGYYGGAPIFIEPMVSRDLLLERADFALEMPVIHGVPTGVRYPTEFRAVYEPGSDAYELVFSGFGSTRARAGS